MKRVIVDTNVYELMLKSIDRHMLESAISKRNIIFYGNSIIRKELRGIPKIRKELIEGRARSLRNLLLQIYDFTVGGHNITVTSQMEEFAEKYAIVYKALGGFASKEEIMSDFKIVACASISKLDLLISEDERTMLSETAVKSYESVNRLFGLRTPKFIKFKELKQELGR